MSQWAGRISVATGCQSYVTTFQAFQNNLFGSSKHTRARTMPRIELTCVTVAVWLTRTVIGMHCLSFGCMHVCGC